MAAHVLVVDDDDMLRLILRSILTHHGFDVSVASHAEEALRLFPEVAPDLVIVDLMMPGMSGFELIKEIRAKREHAKLPLLVLTARHQLDDKFAAFEIGANDYLTKPYEPLEVVYRVKSLLSLRSDGSDRPSVISVGRVTLDTGNCTATVEGREVSLGRKEAAVLEYLMRHHDRIHSAEDVSSNVLRQEGDRARSVDAAQTHVRNLRQKLEADPAHPTVIVTVGRKGYQFVG